MILYFFFFSFLTVIGALIGKQTGRNLEIMNSFELVFDKIEGDIVIDKDYYSTKEQQCNFIYFFKEKTYFPLPTKLKINFVFKCFS